MKKAVTGNRFIDFANEIAGRYEGIPGAFDSPMMNYLAEEKPQASEETPLPSSITYINDITNIREENILYKNNISFLTNILQKQFYKNFFPTIQENVEKIVKETVISENEKIYEKVSENAEKIAYDHREKLVSQISNQIINKISNGSTDTLKYLKSIPELAGKEETLYRSILNVLPEKKKEEAGAVTTKTVPMLVDEPSGGHKVFRMAEVPVNPVKKPSENVLQNVSKTNISLNNTYSINSAGTNNLVYDNTVINSAENNISNVSNSGNITVNNAVTNNNIVNSNTVNNAVTNNDTVNGNTVNNAATNNNTVNSNTVSNAATNNYTVNSSAVNSASVNKIVNNIAASDVFTENSTVSNSLTYDNTENNSTENNNTVNNNTVNNSTVNNSTVNNSTLNNSTLNNSTVNNNTENNSTVNNTVYNREVFNSSAFTSDIYSKGTVNVNKNRQSVATQLAGQELVYLENDEVQSEARNDAEAKAVAFGNTHDKALVVKLVSDTVDKAVQDEVKSISVSKKGTDILHNAEILENVLYQATEKHLEKYYETVFEKNVFENENIRTLVKNVITNKVYRKLSEYVTQDNLSETLLDEENVKQIRNTVRSSFKSINEIITENVTENITENITEDITRNISENNLKNITENITENFTGNTSENISRNISENVLRNVSNNRFENISKNIFENKTVSVSEDVSVLVHDDISAYLTENKSDYSPEKVSGNTSDTIAGNTSGNKFGSTSDGKADYGTSGKTVNVPADIKPDINNAYSPLSFEYNSADDEEARQMLERVTGQIALNQKSEMMRNTSPDRLNVSEILLSAKKADNADNAANVNVSPAELVMREESDKKADTGNASESAAVSFDSGKILNNAERLILQYVPEEQARNLYGSSAVMAARNVARNELDHVILEYAKGDVTEQAAGEQIESIIGRVEKAYSDAGVSYMTDSLQRPEGTESVNLTFRNAEGRLAEVIPSENRSSAGRSSGRSVNRNPLSLSYNPEGLQLTAQQVYDEAPLVYGSDPAQTQEELTRQTKVLTEQVREVQKNVTVVNREKIVNEKEITDIAEKVVKNIVKNELKSADNVSETENMIRRETSAQVSSRMDENISHITDRVYQKLEQRLRTERGRRGLI